LRGTPRIIKRLKQDDDVIGASGQRSREFPTDEIIL
jgi:hypothetical protein